MKTAATLLLFFLSFSFLHAQDSLRYSVHFDSDQFDLSELEQQKLNTFIHEIDPSRIESIELKGHTDSDASDNYNLNLSEKRVISVREFLSKQKISSAQISAEHFGESVPIDDNSIDEGKRNNRRVELVVRLSPEKTRVVEVVQVFKPDCTADTTLIFPQGTEVTLNLCDYYSIKDCFEFTEYNTGESVRNSELTTQTADGTPLISGGMFEVKMCKDVEITVDIPQRSNPCDSVEEFKLWQATREGAWERITGSIQSIQRNGQNFLRTAVRGTTTVNLDALPAIPPPKMIVKVPRNYTIVKAKLSTDTPVALVLPFETKGRKAKFRSICPCSEPLIYLEVQTPKGELVTINFEELNDFDTHEAFGQCQQEEVIKRILFFRVRKKSMYRKYLIRKEDLKVKTSL